MRLGREARLSRKLERSCHALPRFRRCGNVMDGNVMDGFCDVAAELWPSTCSLCGRQSMTVRFALRTVNRLENLNRIIT